MIEVFSDYTSHFYDMYFQKHDGKHLTGDRMKILKLNLPFVMRDTVKAAKEGHALYGAALIEVQSDGIIRVHMAAVEYNMQCKKFGMNAVDLV